MVVVTDRLDLEDQLKRNFISSGAFGSAIAVQKDGDKSRALSGRDLAKRIGSGTERITFTLVHKFNTASKQPGCRNDSPNLIARYKSDLRFFVELRQTAGRDAMETVDYSAYEDQIRKLVDKQVIGTEVRGPEGVYVVHQLGKSVDPAQWSTEKTRNETDMIKTRLRKTIEQDFADDPYAQKVFGELLRLAISEAEAMFDHPLKQYALFKNFEDKMSDRTTPGLPDSLADQPHASAYFGAMRLVLGEHAFAALEQTAVEQLTQQAVAIDSIVRTAVAENSLSPQNIEAAIRKAVLPLLFADMGLDFAKAVVEQIIQITRIGLSRQ